MMKYAEDVTEVTPEEKKEMPTTKEFVSAKLSSGFNFMGKKFGQGAKLVTLKKDLAFAEGQLNTLAKEIGKNAIEQVLNGADVVQVPETYKQEAFDIKLQIDRLREEIKNV